MELDTAPVVENQEENIVKETKFDLSATQIIEEEEEEGPKELKGSRPVSRRVEIERVKSGYSDRAHNESNLPNVLNEYGLSMNDERLKSFHKDKKKRKKSAEKRGHLDEESMEKLRKKREERYQVMMADIQNQPDVTNQFFSKRVSGIMERVDKQQKGELSPRKPKSADPDDGQKQDPHRFKKKLEKHPLKHDSSFLKEIPKSDMAKIVELQEKLTKEGKLKSQRDIDKFWEDMKKPEVFKSYFRNSKLQESNSLTTMSSNKSVPASGMKSYTSNKNVKEGWAVTQQVQHKYDSKQEINTKSNLTAGQLAKQAAADLEKRFPKLVMPPLKSLTIELGEKPPDPEELIREAELKAKIKQRKMFLRKLTRMHQMAMTNSAAAARIMEKHDNISQLMEDKTLRDVREIFSGIEKRISVFPRQEEDAYITQDDISLPQPIDYNHIRERTMSDAAGRGASQQSARSKTSQVSAADSKKSAKSTSNLLKRRKSLKEDKNTLPPKEMPLTLDEIRSKNKVIEAKCLSTFWTNYAKTSPSVAAPS